MRDLNQDEIDAVSGGGGSVNGIAGDLINEYQKNTPWQVKLAGQVGVGAMFGAYAGGPLGAIAGGVAGAAMFVLAR
jgi:hypothetical protein